MNRNSDQDSSEELVNSFSLSPFNRQRTTQSIRAAWRLSNELSAFSLTELLVVIAIIAILAALLFPSLTQAKTKAQGVQCLSQLKQFSYAWNLYANDHQEWIPPNNGMMGPTFLETNTWVQGWLDNDYGPNWPDNTNTIYLQESLIAPYLARSVSIWRCPGDKSTSRHNGHRLPRVRSYSMNNYLNSIDPGLPDPWRIVRRSTDMVAPPPSQTFVFIDEREDSIQDCLFVVDMFHPAAGLAAVPRSAHGGAGSLSFADGHAELKKWRDWRTKPPLQKQGFIGLIPEWRSWPVNQDMIWLRERTTGLR